MMFFAHCSLVFYSKLIVINFHTTHLSKYQSIDWSFVHHCIIFLIGNFVFPNVKIREGYSVNCSTFNLYHIIYKFIDYDMLMHFHITHFYQR